MNKLLALFLFIPFFTLSFVSFAEEPSAKTGIIEEQDCESIADHSKEVLEIEQQGLKDGKVKVSAEGDSAVSGEDVEGEPAAP